jgi:septin family protein
MLQYVGQYGWLPIIGHVIPFVDILYNNNKNQFQKDDVEKRNLLSEKMTPFDDKNLRILLVGPVDSGKSSFIDSVQSALRNKITADASIRFARTTPENLSSTTEKVSLHIFMRVLYNQSKT